MSYYTDDYEAIQDAYTGNDSNIELRAHASVDERWEQEQWDRKTDYEPKNFIANHKSSVQTETPEDKAIKEAALWARISKAVDVIENQNLTTTTNVAEIPNTDRKPKFQNSQAIQVVLAHCVWGIPALLGLIALLR